MDRTEVVEGWAKRSGEFSPQYYAYHGPNATSEAIRAVLESRVGRDARVLELGCSSGRNLAHLHEHGFSDLHGVDVNDDAFDVMAEAYPNLRDAVTAYRDTIEQIVPAFDDGTFDAVYSVEVLQHLHPDSGWVFEELVRITDGVLVTVEIEGDRDRRGDGFTTTYLEDGSPLYRRNWGEMFSEFDLSEVETESIKRDTLRAFDVSR